MNWLGNKTPREIHSGVRVCNGLSLFCERGGRRRKIKNLSRLHGGSAHDILISCVDGFS